VTAPLRIGVDGRAFASPAGGVRRYVCELYGALAAAAPDVDVVAIGAPAGLALPPRVRRRGAVPFPTNVGWMAASLPLAARGAGLSVFHAPAYKAPLWGVHPQVVTIHDVSYERKPEWDAYRNDRLRRAFYRRGALAADRVVTDSSFSRDEIVAAYGIDPRRIAVVPLAASAVFSAGTFDAGAAPPRVTQPYALHVGDLHLRRNLATAVAAILDLRRGGSPLRLVCAGIDRGIGNELRTAAAADPDALVLTGPVDERALVNLYRGAALLAYPSMYEGFGLPVLEAMQTGVPVVAANCASVPEVAGDAALLIDAGDIGAWRETIGLVARDAALQARLRDAGLARASQFSWTRTARETLAVFEQAAAEGRR
jgi:glycosyltransferase involved in cell wall biosynthesis